MSLFDALDDLSSWEPQGTEGGQSIAAQPPGWTLSGGLPRQML